VKLLSMAMLRLILLLALPINSLGIDNLDINALNLVYDRHKKTATFSGNVVLCFSNIKLTSNKVIFSFKDQNNKEIENVIIPGKLSAIRKENGQNNVILADKGFYSLANETLTLEGNVVIEDKKDVIIAKKMIYHGKLTKIVKNDQ